MQAFIADIDSISKNTDAFIAMLAPADRVRATKFQKTTRKLQFILGHLMVAGVGKKYTSIAHKDKFVVVATASNASVGIDIENVSIKRDFVAASDVMGAKAPKTLYEFYKLFTETEATYKLGTTPVCTHFITHGDYLICITANKQFAKPCLKSFNVASFLVTEKE